jgi:mannose-6-phosphate isomerase-like protein (cupin superfamily)
MRYFIDLDNTLCYTENSNYIGCVPIYDRIKKVNALKEEGHYIVIWTARGATSGIDHSVLTKKQLKDWGVKYDELMMNKPHYDIYIDDKSFNVDTVWKSPIFRNIEKSKKIESPLIVEKGWGREIIFANNNEYCGKLLQFNEGKKFSMHFHIKKRETWYVSKGRFIFSHIDLEKGITNNEFLYVGDIITLERGEPHQLEALEDSEIIEVSTQHFDEDSYRIYKGD